MVFCKVFPLFFSIIIYLFTIEHLEHPIVVVYMILINIINTLYRYFPYKSSPISNRRVLLVVLWCSCVIRYCNHWLIGFWEDVP